MKVKNIFVIILLLIVVLVADIVGSYFWKEYKVKQDEQRLDLYNKILYGASIKPQEITINFVKPISIGSPLIFGGAQYPSEKSSDVWDMLQEVGATAMRTDFYIENMVPSGTSMEDYKKNIDDVRNPDTWNKDFIQGRKDAYSSAKEHGMKTMGIVSYAPSWLTYSHTTRGVPMDWSVYEDIVKKSYIIHRDNLDYVEIWNEPTFSRVFLDVAGSGFTPTEAYEKIFYHAAKAIREVDMEKNDGKRVLIGGPASDNPNDISMLEVIAGNEETRGYIDFISYHNYGYPEASWDAHKSVLEKYHMENLSIFVTEWNYNPKENEDSPSKTSYPAIFYTADKFIDFLKMGVAGANYYSFLQVEASDDDNSQYLGFYRLENGTVELLPQSRTWRLLSKKLGLGEGSSEIYAPQENKNGLNIVGFTNSMKQQGAAIVNESSSPITVNLHFVNAGKKKYIKVLIYYASAENEAKIPVYQGLVKEKNNVLDLPFYIPKETIMGVVFEEEKEWYDVTKLFNK